MTDIAAAPEPFAANPPITIGELTDVPAPGSPIASQWSQEVSRRIIHRFATVAARDAAIPAPQSGMMAYTTAENTFWVYGTSAWAAVLNGTPWIAATLAGTWVNFGLPYATAAYRRVGDIVEVRGVVRSGVVGGNITVLPAGFRPLASSQFATVSAGAFGYITVDSAGQVVASIGAATSFDMAPIRFSTS